VEELTMTRMLHLAAAATLAVLVPVAALAQGAPVTPADVDRLQTNVLSAGADVRGLRATNAARADELQSELDLLAEEVIYLRVKLRREEPVARAEYTDVRDRIEALRSRARNEPPPTAAPAPAVVGAATAGTATNVVPAGTQIDVRLTDTLSSGTAQVEDRFEGATLYDVVVAGRTLIPVGSVVRGVVTDVQPGTRTNRTARMTVTFDQVTVGGQPYPMRGTVTQAIEGEGIRGEAGRTAAGAGIGAVIGGLLGGVRGALVGVLVGGGGTIAATEGEEVELPQGTQLRVRIDSPLTIE
jgi:hypothetical protein